MYGRIRDIDIYFDIAGMGLVPDGSRMREKPKVFVVHGGPGSDHVPLKAGFAPLADRFQLIYFDHRGQGRSGRSDETRYTLHENVEDMEALRQYLGVGPIVSIGTSYGGMVSMAHAARYPSAVSHLILIVTAAHSGFIGRAKEIVGQRGTPQQIAQFEDLLAGRIDTPAKFRSYHEVMGSLYAIRHDSTHAALRLDRSPLSPEPLNRAYGPDGGMRRFDLRPELGRISAPTLILAGRHDWICAPEFSEDIHAHIPGSRLRIFEGSSHAILGDETQELLDVIAGFVL
jgi:proline iminopeptidase